MDITITEDGRVQFIYSDDLAGLLEIGHATVERASHVEPAPGGGWTADMSPSGGPVLTQPDGQPFALRADALAAEVQWLRDFRGL